SDKTRRPTLSAMRAGLRPPTGDRRILFMRCPFSEPAKGAPMTRITPSLLLAGVFALGLQAAPAQAQISRTFVSQSIGNEANACSRATACRTYQGAPDKTNPDGDVTVLDPGGYGSLTITKSISIVNDGVGEASVLVSGGAIGIMVKAGPAGYVNLH